jgi:drug/metabolite transporter (DMT)-like permease
MSRVILLILCVLVLALSGQVLMKKGMNRIGAITLDQPSKLLQIVIEPLVIGGLFCMALGALVWLVILSRADLSYALPLFGGLVYLALPVISWVFLGESLTLARLAGILLISGGVFLVTR